MNLAALIDEHPAGAAALIDDGGAVGYGQLRDHVARVRAALTRRGIEPGDRVAIASANDSSFVTTYLATLGTGAVAVPLNVASPLPELEGQLAATKPKLVVGPPDLGIPDAVPANELDRGGPGDPPPVYASRPEDLAVLVFTSGTAGRPRAAMLTHGNLLANIAQLRASDPGAPSTDDGPSGPRARDVVLGALPMFHIYGLNVVLGFALATGSAVVLIKRFDPQGALAAVRQHGVTVIAGVPTLWSAWANLPSARRDAFATVRLATSGAAPLDPEVARSVQERLGLTLVEGYGLTEASPAVTTALGVDAPPGSVGRPLPDVELRLVDDSAHDVLVGDPGEIWVRGPNVFAGYWGDPEATAAALTDDGWLRTGDVAVVDDSGFLYLVDRAKDLIIVSGFNVFPSEVEDVIAEHPAVAGVAVAGEPHPHTGETVTAYVVPSETSEGRTIALTPEAIIEHTAQRLARYKCPTTVRFLDEIPHNATGKVLRGALSQLSRAAVSDRPVEDS
jgi:long-chain acyl-CoA synthetase